MTTPATDLDAFPAAFAIDAVHDASEAMQALEEQHLVVIGEDPAERRRFAAGLRLRLDLNHRASVVDVQDELLAGAENRAAALEAIPSVLRSADGSVKHQYHLWTELDGLVAHHGPALRRVLDAVFAAAAEQEFVTPDPLVIQRHVLVGGPELARFAAGTEDRPSLAEWLPTGDEEAPAPPSPAPRVLVARLGD